MKTKTVRSEDIERFRKFLYEQEKSASTIKKYIHDVRSFQAYTEGKEVTKELLVSYKASLFQKNYKATSVNSFLVAINQFFSFLGWHQERVKLEKIQKKIYRPEKNDLTKTEYERLVKAAKESGNIRLCVLLQVLAATGMRVSELSAITVEAVKENQIFIRSKGKNREILLQKEIKRLLLQYAEEQGICSGIIFRTKTGKPLDRTNIWREMKKLCKAAKVNPEKVFPHNLRHLFAKEFYEKEKDIAKLADVLGHSSIETTRTYIMTTGKEHQRLLESMHMVTCKDLFQGRRKKKRRNKKRVMRP